MKLRVLLAAVIVTFSATAACAGDRSGASSPESNAGITETSAKADVPPASKAAPASAVPSSTIDGATIKFGAMKLAPAKPGKTDRSLEIKADGTIVLDGKPVAKFKGDRVDSIEGAPMATMSGTGVLAGSGVKPGLKFEGDDLVGDDGMKLSIGDDGTITASRAGKSETIGKAEGGSSAKRAALIAAVLWMTIPTMIGNDSGKPGKPENDKKKPATKTSVSPPSK
jgi:hypothetical protein